MVSETKTSSNTITLLVINLKFKLKKLNLNIPKWYQNKVILVQHWYLHRQIQTLCQIAALLSRSFLHGHPNLGLPSLGFLCTRL